MLYISRWKATAILATALLVCLFAVPNFFPKDMVESWPKWAQRHIVLGLDLQGGSHILLEVDSGAVRKEKVEQLRDDVRRVVRENRLGSAAAVVGARQYASSSVSARAAISRWRCRNSRNCRSRSAACWLRPASAPSMSPSRRRPVPADRHRAGTGRAHPPIGRAVDPDHRAARQRARHRRALDPAPGRRSRAGAGAGPAGSGAPEGIARQDRQAHLPDGRSIDPAPSRRSRARFRRSPKSCWAPRRRTSSPI